MKLFVQQSVKICSHGDMSVDTLIGNFVSYYVKFPSKSVISV